MFFSLLYFGVKVDLLPEITLAPRVLSNYVTALSHNAIRSDLDKFLQTRHQPVHFLTELPAKLRLSAHEVRYPIRAYIIVLCHVSHRTSASYYCISYHIIGDYQVCDTASHRITSYTRHQYTVSIIFVKYEVSHHEQHIVSC